jgi:DNA-binding CsgD family transcriptional regulator
MNHLDLARVLTRADYDPGAVVDLAERMLRDLDQSYGQLIFDPMNGPTLARLFSRLGMVEQLDGVLAASRRLASQNHDTRCWLASTLHVEGLRRRDVAALLTAAARFDDCERPLAAAFALTDALHEARHRAHSRVSQLLRRARNRLEELGAAAAVDHLEMASSRRGSRGRPIAGWQSLTPAELKVVNLAATGATNKEIAEELWISPYTVDTHMRHSLAKLGLRSRVALARLAAQHELGAETEAGSGALTGPSPQSGRQAARGPKRTPRASEEDQRVVKSSSAPGRRPR